MFQIDVLPAQRGDCFWLTYGEPGDLHHVLIDGGPQETIPTLVPELEQRISALPGRTSRVELLVITHIDADHIQGVVSLLSDHRRVELFRDIWFNGWRHLGLLGGPDAERLTAALLRHPRRWNQAFGGDAVVIPDTGPLPTVALRGGLTITLLGPTQDALRRLAPEWETACRKAGIIPGEGAAIARKSWIRDELLGGFEPDLLAQVPFRADRGAPNGSSISMIAEYDDQRILLLGDAHAKATGAALDRVGTGPHQFAAVKLSHHGSRGNTSLDLLSRIHCTRWIVSSNGAQFGHPDQECLARVVVTQRQPTFYLNYETEQVADLIAGAGARYKVRRPKRDNGITITL